MIRRAPNPLLKKDLYDLNTHLWHKDNMNFIYISLNYDNKLQKLCVFYQIMRNNFPNIPNYENIIFFASLILSFYIAICPTHIQL
jgi:hypothetical protein